MTTAVLPDRGARAPHIPSGYRADIEGLRAVAVLLVMASHAGLTWFEGGYIGVDVFFVISGFLITQMLVRELRSTGTVRLRRFYARRARRLLPASATVLVVCAAVAWLFLPQNRWVTTAQDIMWSAVYGVNWSLSAQSVDYLRADSAPSIVQHFWSLAVEEQFYIVWPCLLVGVAAFARLRGTRNLNSSIMITLAVVGLPSLAWSIFYTDANPARAYFVTTTRLWELALGAAVAILVLNGRALPRVVGLIAAWAGLGAIVAAGLMFTTATAFPGYWALVPTLGAAAVIYGGVPAGPGVRGSAGSVLAVGPMETVGRLSYSLYLCHWPLVVVATAVLGVLDPIVGLIVVASSALPAYLLHHHVENPVRFSRSRLRRSTPMLQFAALATVVSLTAGMILHLTNWPPAPPFVPPTIGAVATSGLNGGREDEDSEEQESSVDLAADPGGIFGALVLDKDPLGDEKGAPQDTSVDIVPGPLAAAQDYTDCTQSAESAEIRTCTYGVVDSDKVLAVVGDSHANQWVPGLTEIAATHGWRVVEYTKAACTFADVLITTKEGQPYDSCLEWSGAVLDQLLNVDKPGLVVTAGIKKRVWLNGEASFGQEGTAALATGLRRSYETLTAAGIPVVVLQDTPVPQTDIAECVQTNPTQLTACAGDRTTMLPSDHGSEQIQAIDGLDDVRMVDMNDAVCPTDRCAAVIGNVLVYRDASHLTGTYVRTLVPRLDERIGLDQL